MSLIHISDKWTSVRRTKQSLKQSSTRCQDTPSAGLVLEVNLLWQEVKYCGDEKWWHYITGHFLLRYSYRVLQSHQGSLVYFRANNRAHTRTPGVRPLEVPETSCSGVAVTEPPSQDDTPVCGELYVQLAWFIVHQKYGVDSRVFRPELQLHCLERKLQCNFLACYVLNPWGQCHTLRLGCCSQVKTHVMPTRHKDRNSMFHSHYIWTECK